MATKQVLIIVLLLISISSCSQTVNETECSKKIDQLYAKQKLHLIFCSYYFEKVSKFSGADTILNNLSFYRDTVNTQAIERKDHVIIDNLKKNICNNDTSLITKMNKWGEVSIKIAETRSKENFTLEGYMEFLNDDNITRIAVSPFLKEDRTIYSLSSNEMEAIYFRSIGIVSSLQQKYQESFFNKLQSWDFK